MIQPTNFLKFYATGMLSAAVASLAAGYFAWRRGRRTATSEPTAQTTTSPPAEPDHTQGIVRRTIQYFVIPLWLAAGLTDWWCHRRTDIEHTTGLKETAIHLMLLGEAAIPVLAGLFLEIDAPVLSLMIAAFFTHEATAMWDVTYAVTRRDVQPVEQHVHSFLEMVPLLAVSLVTVLRWPHFMALLGQKTLPAQTPRFKREPLGLCYAVSSLGAMALFEVLPYLEEAWRDWRANPGRWIPPKKLPA
ncbi:diguanylate cyclase [Acetobacter estunensis NRIC 0472]|uniref:Diguanylate cyclase n=1 Tax=Acetobacter estunensis TaxID=104097 RepID=A0A967B2B8_9PROT|nr:hypothetical protein [Acetobacter estunensis]NHO52422.1 hypothetical protein [Acetobacter estunensis]GBQ25943.1 diguanylate cyclase [Acetobacter estunensis NRIC 0472]